MDERIDETIRSGLDNLPTTANEGVRRVDRGSTASDLIGVYVPKHDGRTLIGGIANGFIEDFEHDGALLMRITSYTYSFSMVHFPQGVLGQGPFVRGDLGLSRLTIDSSTASSEESDLGYGGLVGLGLSFRLTQGTFVSLTETWSFRRIEGETTSAWSTMLFAFF